MPARTPAGPTGASSTGSRCPGASGCRRPSPSAGTPSAPRRSSRPEEGLRTGNLFRRRNPPVLNPSLVLPLFVGFVVSWVYPKSGHYYSRLGFFSNAWSAFSEQKKMMRKTVMLWTPFSCLGEWVSWIRRLHCFLHQWKLWDVGVLA